MIEVLIALHFIILIIIYRGMSDLVGRIISLTYLVYMAAFTIVKPALLYYFDLYFSYSTNENGAVQSLLFGSLLFLVVQSVGIAWLSSGFNKMPRAMLEVFNFDGVSNQGVKLAYIIMMVVSFVGCAIKFGNYGYLFSAVDSFEATMNLANGSWYVNYIAEFLFYGLLMFLATTYWRCSAGKSFFVMILSLAFTYFWIKMAARTPVLVVMVTWAAVFFSIEKQKRVNLIYIAMGGYLLLILLYVGNKVRTGSLDDLSLNTAIFEAVFAAAADLSPVDNATLMYADMVKYQGTDFMRLIGAINPLVLLPSSIFPFKLPADKDAELTRIFFPNGPDAAFYHEGSTLTFTVPASGYSDFEYLGVFVASFIYVCLFCIYMAIYKRGDRSARFISTYQMIVHIIGFRLSIETMLISFYTSILFFTITRKMALLFGLPVSNGKSEGR